MAEETLQERMRKELLEKENWYRTRKDEVEDEESPRKYRKAENKGKKATAGVENINVDERETQNKSKGKDDQEVTSVIFVPHTSNSNLARKLKEKEDTLKEITGNKGKYGK